MIVLRGFLFLVLLWCAGLVAFVQDMNTLKGREAGIKAPPVQADAIIVLTGGADRLKAGLTLLNEGRAKRLLLSGVHKSVQRKDLFLSENLPVSLGYKAQSTIENAIEAQDWLTNIHAHSFILVTAHYHLRRALLEFHRLLDDYEIIPHAVVPVEFQEESTIWENSSLVVLLINEYNKYIVALCRSALWSFLS